MLYPTESTDCILFSGRKYKPKYNIHPTKPIRQYLTIYKARSDGSLKFDFNHKNAFAPELTFNIVDPERKDEKFWSYAVQDVTEEEKDTPDVVNPVPSAGE